VRRVHYRAGIEQERLANGGRTELLVFPVTLTMVRRDSMKDLTDCRVLLVDDAKTNLDILVEGLKSEHKLSLAFNGEMALQIAARTPPDLVLLDIVMPGLDGYEVCQRLRRMPATADVPIMFLSSLEELQNKTRGFEVGANDYLTKPFEMLEVKARVRSLLKAKAYNDAVKEQIASELRVAREIQMGILPGDVPGAANGTGLEAHALLYPAQEVGGDLYEVLRMPDGNLLVVVGDVSGKGIPAALFMAVTVTLVRAFAAQELIVDGRRVDSAEGHQLSNYQLSTPQELLRRVNDALASHNPSTMFVTLLCAIYDVPTGRLSYASAGHPPAVLIRDGVAQFLPLKPGIVAGIAAGLSAPGQSVQLLPSDLVVFYTDGVTEAFNTEGSLYGESRLLEELAGRAGCTAAVTTESLLRSVRAYAGQRPQSDDIALLALKREA
jgi:phosphoserine phosphatase RsbU/P